MSHNKTDAETDMLALLDNQQFQSFAHGYFRKHAPTSLVYRSNTCPHLDDEYGWVVDNLSEVAHAWSDSDPAFAGFDVDTNSPAPATTKSPPARKSSTPTNPDTHSKKNKSNDNGGDKKPAATRKRKTVHIDVDDDDNTDPKVQGTPQAEPNMAGMLAQIVGAQLMGSPEFRKEIEKFVAQNEVATAQASRPAQAASSAPVPVAPVPPVNLNARFGEGQPTHHMASRSRASAQKIRAAANQCRDDAKADLMHMVEDFTRKGKDPKDSNQVLGLARGYYLDQMDRRRHLNKVTIVKEILSTMLLTFFGNANGFTSVEIEHITGPPRGSDDLIPKYKSRKDKGGRKPKSQE